MKVTLVPAVRVVVATFPRSAGVAEVLVQYGRNPAVSFVEVETVPEPEPEPVGHAVLQGKSPVKHNEVVERAVVDAYGNMLACVVDVAWKYEPFINALH